MLLCALCSPEGEIVGSASHAPTIPKGKAIAELVACALPLPQSPSGAPGDPLQQLKEGPGPSSRYVLAVAGLLSITSLLCHHLTPSPVA